MRIIDKDTFAYQIALLLPSGRAWRLYRTGNNKNNMYKLFEAIGVVKTGFYNACYGILNMLIPDNQNFTSADADKWESIMSLETNIIDLESRKAIIYQKMSIRGGGRYKLSAKYIESQLRTAGFDVYVHENRFYNSTTNTYEWQDLSSYLGGVAFQHGEVQHGQNQHGQEATKGTLANYINATKDESFVFGNNWAGVFIVGGQTLGSIASIDATKEQSLRKLLLQIKPLNTTGILLIDFI